MSVDYNMILSPMQKREILTSRMSQIASEAYQVSLNKKTAEQVGSAEQVEKIEESLKLLEAAIIIHQKELDALPSIDEMPTV